MAVALHSFKIDEDGKVRMAHVFYAETPAEAERRMRAHAEGCPDFGPALKSGETIELVEEIDELPEADGDALEEFLGLQEDEDDEEESIDDDPHL